MKYTCSKCKKKGHNARTCKKKASKKALRKRSTKKAKSKKTKTKTTKQVMLTASYDISKHNLNSKITKATGRRASGGGMWVDKSIYDLDFEFPDRAAAEAAAKRIRKIKGIKKVRIWSY